MKNKPDPSVMEAFTEPADVLEIRNFSTAGSLCVEDHDIPISLGTPGPYNLTSLENAFRHPVEDEPAQVITLEVDGMTDERFTFSDRVITLNVPLQKPIEKRVIAVDFDGTCVGHDFPRIGPDIGAVTVLRRLVEAGHSLVLFTMRSDISNPKSEVPEITQKGGNYLTDAVNWFKKHNIPLYGINTNPTQSRWTKSLKAYAHLYIDDASLGCPLRSCSYFDPQEGVTVTLRDCVDWDRVEGILENTGYLNKK